MQEDELPQLPPDKLQVVHGAGGESEADERKDAGPTAAEIEAAMAGKIRADGAERSAMTLAETLFSLVPLPQRGNITAMLEEMSADSRYADIKAVTTASGSVFFFSTRHIPLAEAFPRSRLEDGKLRVAEVVRADSRERARLTPVEDLPGVTKQRAAAEIGQLVPALVADDRYGDIRSVTVLGAGEYLYSARHISGGYADVLIRAAAKDDCATVVDTVREESRIYPRATNIRTFCEKVFGIRPDTLDDTVAEILRRTEYADIKKLVHPSTGGVYLYSDRFLTEPHAFALMDWEEVGKDDNP